MNAAYMLVLTTPEMVEAPTVAVLFGDKVMGNLHFLVPLGVTLSTFAGGLSGQFGVAR